MPDGPASAKTSKPHTAPSPPATLHHQQAPKEQQQVPPYGSSSGETIWGSSARMGLAFLARLDQRQTLAEMTY